MFSLRLPTNILESNLIVSSENDTKDKVQSDSTSIARFKLRYRFKCIPNWVIDLTIVRQLNGQAISSHAKEIKTTMFVKPLDPFANSFDSAPYKFEIEAEYTGSPENLTSEEILKATNKVSAAIGKDKITDSLFQNEIYYIATFVEENPHKLEKFRSEYGIKKLAPAVIPLNKAMYRNMYPPVGYSMSIKADGVHAFVSVHDKKCCVLADKFYEIPAPANVNQSQLTMTTIVDCELIYTTPSDAKDLGFETRIFDVIAVDGRKVTDEGFEKRIALAETASNIIKQFGIKISPKMFIQLTEQTPEGLKKEMDKVMEEKYPFKTDGAILVEPGQIYRNTSNYKFKSIEDNTIDFLAMRCPPSVLGRPPFVDRKDSKLYLLFNGITPEAYHKMGFKKCKGYEDIFGKTKVSEHRSNYFPIQFSPSDCPLAYLYQHPNVATPQDVHENIVELRCKDAAASKQTTKGTKGSEAIVGVGSFHTETTCSAAGGITQLPNWELVKIRDSGLSELTRKRYFGNNFRITELTWINYLDPFPYKQLWNGPVGSYFKREKSGIYFAQTAYTSFIKSRRIQSYHDYDRIYDFGAGQGQDLKRYMDAQVKFLMVLDKDRTALAELSRRKFDIAAKMENYQNHGKNHVR